LEGEYGDEQIDADDIYYEEHEEMNEEEVQALMEQVLNLTEQTGDPNIAMQLLELDPYEKSVVVKNLREYFYLQQK